MSSIVGNFSLLKTNPASWKNDWKHEDVGSRFILQFLSVGLRVYSSSMTLILSI